MQNSCSFALISTHVEVHVVVKFSLRTKIVHLNQQEMCVLLFTEDNNVRLDLITYFAVNPFYSILLFDSEINEASTLE